MALVCDRCGTKIPKNKDHTTIIFIPAEESDLPEYDICVACTQEFGRWVAGAPLARARARDREEITSTARPRSP